MTRQHLTIYFLLFSAIYASLQTPALAWAIVSGGCPMTTRTFAAAAKAGNLYVMQWLLRAGCPWSARTCEAAASEGNLGALQWARHYDCRWDIWTPTAAARGGESPMRIPAYTLCSPICYSLSIGISFFGTAHISCLLDRSIARSCQIDRGSQGVGQCTIGA